MDAIEFFRGVAETLKPLVQEQVAGGDAAVEENRRDVNSLFSQSVLRSSPRPCAHSL